jgi:signal transduction histidine kinase
MHLAAFIQRRGLLRVFALYSFVSIIGITIVSGYIYFSFLQQNLLQREMTISSEFIQSVSLINKPEAYFNGSTDIADKEAIEEFFNHVVGIPDVFRVNVFDDDYKIIWSNDNGVIGSRFRDNEELDLAYQGRSSFNKTEVDEREKQEHDFLPDDIDQFVESYIPVWNESHEQVIGVVELYKSPRALFDALGRGRNLVIWVSLLGGLVLYGLLFGVVRIAHRQIEAQRSRTKQASSRAVEINEESLRRISSELQNGPIKSIESAISGLDSFFEPGAGAQSHEDSDNPAANAIRSALKDALEKTRSISVGSQIPELEDLSAREAIIRVIEKHEQNTSTRVGKQIGQIPETLNNATKICIFRLVQEGLRNAYGRGGGIGQYVRVSVKGPQLILSIGEIGHDIDVNDSNNIYHSEDLALRGMRERIESLGGEFYIFSDSRSGGINLRAYLPVVD